RFAFSLTNEKSTNQFWNHSRLYENAFYNAGIWKGEIGFEKTFRKQDIRNPKHSKIWIKTKYLINDLSFRDYLLYPQQWGPEQLPPPDRNFINGVIDLAYFKNYTYTGGSGNFTITLRSPSIGSDYNYGYLNLNSVTTYNLKK